MGFAILCALAVCGLGAIFLTAVEAVPYHKRCQGCQVSLTATVCGGERCEMTVRHILHAVQNGPLPVSDVVFYADCDETFALLTRLCGDAPRFYVERLEDSDAFRKDYGDGDRDRFCQPRKRVYRLRNRHSQ